MTADLIPGWAEHEAEPVWWADCAAICVELLPQATDPSAALGVSGIGRSGWPADESGQPLRPAILYEIDTQATREIDELTAQYGAVTILARYGSLLTSQAVGPKLAWLHRNEPGVWARTRYFFLANSRNLNNVWQCRAAGAGSRRLP